eukprot:11190955-Lingulodinium_polyedra.AAC.1
MEEALPTTHRDLPPWTQGQVPAGLPHCAGLCLQEDCECGQGLPLEAPPRRPHAQPQGPCHSGWLGGRDDHQDPAASADELQRGKPVGSLGPFGRLKVDYHEC